MTKEQVEAAKNAVNRGYSLSRESVLPICDALLRAMEIIRNSGRKGKQMRELLREWNNTGPAGEKDKT